MTETLNNPVILATHQASQLIYETFDNIWTTMEAGRESQNKALTAALESISKLAESEVKRHEQKMEQLSMARGAVVAAMTNAEQTAIAMQGIVGDVVPNPSEGDVPEEVTTPPKSRKKA